MNKIRAPRGASGKFRGIVCRELLQCDKLTRANFIAIDGSDRTALDNALQLLRTEGTIDRDIAGVFSIKDRTRAIAIASLAPLPAALREVEARNDAAVIAGDDPLADQRTPIDRAVDDIIEKSRAAVAPAAAADPTEAGPVRVITPPAHVNGASVVEPVVDDPRKLCLGINEDGEIECFRRDGEGSIMFFDESEWQRMVAFELATRELRLKLLKERLRAGLPA